MQEKGRTAEVIATSLAAIHIHKPHNDGWTALLRGLGKRGPDQAPLPILRILDVAGLDEAIWAMRTLDDQHKPFIGRFALDCLERAESFAIGSDGRSRQALANGLAWLREPSNIAGRTPEELAIEAWWAAKMAVGVEAAHASRIAMSAGMRAKAEAWFKARGTAADWQEQHLRNMLEAANEPETPR